MNIYKTPFASISFENNIVKIESQNNVIPSENYLNNNTIIANVEIKRCFSEGNEYEIQYIELLRDHICSICDTNPDTYRKLYCKYVLSLQFEDYDIPTPYFEQILNVNKKGFRIDKTFPKWSWNEFKFIPQHKYRVNDSVFMSINFFSGKVKPMKVITNNILFFCH